MNKVILFFLSLCFLAIGAFAQQAAPKKVDEVARFKTRLDAIGRIDSGSGLVRARYGQFRIKTYRSPERFLREEATAYGWSSEGEDLELMSERVRRNSRHLTYQQMFAGLPVESGQVRINMDREGRVSMVISSFVPVNADQSRFVTTPTLRAGAAATRAIEVLARNGGRVSEAELVITNPENPRLVWKMIVWPEDEPAEYRVLIDAHSGELVHFRDQMFSSGAHSSGKMNSDEQPDPEKKAPKRVDGSGFVFDPDPLFTAGVPYQAPYLDNTDATNAELDAARALVTLPGITQNGNGMYVLEGPFVRIVDRAFGGSPVIAPPQESTPDGFLYDRSQSGFEAVMSYYHIDKSQRYVQSLGITDIQNNGVTVSPQGFSRDESLFSPAQNWLVFGTGGVDDAEDPAVIWHEYGHALLHAGAPGVGNSIEGDALHEGFADYWAASYTRSLVESSQTGRDDWRWIFLWDSGEGSIWPGRFLDHFGIYPQDVCVAATGSGDCNIHDDGRMWATTLMEVYDQLGRELTDELVLLSHAYLGTSVTFADAAQAVVQADLDNFAGANASVLINVFAPRGLIELSQFAPLITHTRLPNTEFVGLTQTVTAQVQGLAAPVSTVEFVYESTTLDQRMIFMTPTSGDEFSGQFQLPAVFDTVRYYIRALDSGGRESFSPEDAPTETHFFVVGEDLTAPLITHEPPSGVTFLGWPVALSGSAVDNFGVGLVEADYTIFNASGTQTSDGVFIISSTGGSFETEFPVELEEIEDGSRIDYFLRAVDSSERLNESRLPESGVFSFLIHAGSVLQFFDFNQEAGVLHLSGEWEQGEPEFGTISSPSGTAVLATNSKGPYSSTAGLDAARLPGINLASIDPSVLRIWHYFDTEHDGSADPLSNGASLSDGALVQYRTPSTPLWQPLTPVGGYNGTLSSTNGNPLGGSPAFGGFSYGWRWDEFVLPQENGLELRFAFAKDNGNTGIAERFAGWIIDTIEITTNTVQDVQAPVVLEEPAFAEVLSVDSSIPEIRIEARDDLGVVDAFLDWTFVSRAGTQSGSMRMTQDAEDLQMFVAFLDFAAAPEPGDQVSYFIRIFDPSGHETKANSNSAFTIQYRLFESTNALNSIWASGSWTLFDGTWEAGSIPPATVSGLNLSAHNLESNADVITLVLEHEYDMGLAMAGLLQFSIDQGESWQPLTPDGGYPGVAALESTSQLNGKSAFTGNSGSRIESRFDLNTVFGEQIMVRILVESSISTFPGSFWKVYSAVFSSQTDDLGFSTTSEFDLQNNFPNPFTNRTQITVSVDETAPASLRVFDALGREVAVLLDGILDAGSHSFTFDASRLAGGVYIARFRSRGREKTRTMILLGQ